MSGRWRLGGILALSMAFATFAPFALSTLAPFLLEEFGLTRSQFGAAVSILFAVATLSSPPVGRAIDRIRTRGLLWLPFLGAALSLAIIGLARSYWWLIIAAVVAGANQAVANPATNRLAALHASGPQRGVLIGVKQSGVQAGALLAGVLLPRGGVAIGWRATLWIAAGVSAVLGVLAPRVLVGRAAPEDASLDVSSRGPTSVVYWMMAYAFFMASGAAIAHAYLPLYSFERLGFDARHAGMTLAAVAATGVVARLVLGHAVGRVRDPKAVLVSLTGVALIAQIAVIAAQGTASWLVWLGCVGLGSSAIAYNSVAIQILVEEVGNSRSGRATGMLFLAIFTGFTLSPLGFGFVVDATSSYALAWSGGVVAYGLAGVVATAWLGQRRSKGRPQGLTAHDSGDTSR